MISLTQSSKVLISSFSIALFLAENCYFFCYFILSKDFLITVSSTQSSEVFNLVISDDSEFNTV